MTRIIAGAVGGRRLDVPPGEATRPTSDRAREGLFSTLLAVRGTLLGARVLDLYAGSGALGLEALSRGAARVTFVENARPALRALRANVAAVDLPGVRVCPLAVERWLEAAAAEAAAGADPPAGYDVVFADPPYRLPADRVAAVLAALVAAGRVPPGALAVVERSSREPPFPWPAGWGPLRARRYGQAMLWYGRAA